MRLAWLRRLVAGVVVAGREFGRIPAYSDEGERRFRELRRTAAPPARQAGDRDGAAIRVVTDAHAPAAGAPVPSDGALSLT